MKVVMTIKKVTNGLSCEKVGISASGREAVCRSGSEFHSWVELENWIRKYKLYTSKTFFEINFNEVFL